MYFAIASIFVLCFTFSECHMKDPFPPVPCVTIDKGYDMCLHLSDQTRHLSNGTLVDPLDLKLQWIANETHVQFKMSGVTWGWMGFGFSRTGQMESGWEHPYTDENGTFGDLILMFVSGVEGYIYDCYAHWRLAKKDAQQDVQRLSFSRDGERITFEFVRKRFTGDIYRDYNFTDDDLTYLIWAADYKLPHDVTLNTPEPTTSFLRPHHWYEYFPMETWSAEKRIVKEKAIQVSSVLVVGLAIVVIGLGVVTTVCVRLKRKGKKQLMKDGNQLSVQDGLPSLVLHEDIEISISSESS